MKKPAKIVVISGLLVLLSFSFLSGEELTIDILKKQLETAQDSDKPAILNTLSKMTLDYSPREASKYAELALQLAQKYNSIKEEALAFENRGMAFKHTSNYLSALKDFKKARDIYTFLNDKEGLARNFNNTGIIYREQHKYSLAMVFYEKSLEFQLDLGNKMEIGRSLNNMGNIYNEQLRYFEALDYYQEALSIFEGLENERAVAIILNNIALIYKELLNSKKALEYCRTALKISRKINNKRLLSITLDNMGTFYTELEYYPEAIQMYQESLELQIILEDKEGTAFTLTDMGKVYQKTGQYRIALDHHFQSAAIFEKLDDYLNLIYPYNNIARTYLALADYEKSEFYLKKIGTIIQNNPHLDKAAIREHYLISSELFAGKGDYHKAYQFHLLYSNTIESIFTGFTGNAGEMIKKIEKKYDADRGKMRKELLEKKRNIMIILFIGGLCLFTLLITLLYIFYRQRLNERETKKRITFFMNLAHEIKTPLTLIRSYFSRYIKNHSPSNSLDLIQLNLDTLIRYILDFFTLEKLERGHIVYDHSSTVAINPVCEKITELSKSACAEKGISISYRGPESNAYIDIDPDALNTIVYNLLHNAVKYTGKGGLIDVFVKDEHTKVVLKVKDTGIGIDNKKLNTIFYPFARLLTNKSQIEGVGLGLTIVKNIIDQIDGRIQLKSKLNEGTEFILTFIKSSARPQETSNAKIDFTPFRVRKSLEYPEVVHSKNRPTILIVEDEPDILGCLKELFDETGFNTYTGENGKDALEKLKTIPRPDVIISDIMMDSMNGYVFFDYISKDKCFNTIPFVFLSARTADDDILKGLKLGAVDYIPKPFDNEKLVARVEALIEFTKKNEQIMRKESTKISENIKSIPIDEKACTIFDVTRRQKDILRLLQIGYTYKKTGEDLGISEGSIKKQIALLKEKTEKNSKNEILKLFFYK